MLDFIAYRFFSPIPLAVSLALSLVVARPTALPAQSGTTFRHIGKREGLSQSSVFAIAQDGTGYMWFGTRDGLNRYDGHDFRVYRDDSTRGGPLGDDIRVLRYDASRGCLWVGSTVSLSAYQPAVDSFRHFAGTPVGGTAVKAIYLDAGGGVLVGTARGLAAAPPGGTDFAALRIEGLDEPGASDIGAVLRDRGGRLWVGTEAGAFWIDESGGRRRARRPALGLDEAAARTPVRALHEDTRGWVYFGTNGRGVIRYSPASGAVAVLRRGPASAGGLTDDDVRAFADDGAGGVWIATFDGLTRYDGASGAATHLRDSGRRSGKLSDGSVREVFRDRVGGLWVGTYYGGVNHVDPRYAAFRNYGPSPSRDGLNAEVVSSFGESPTGDLLIGTEGGGLNVLGSATQSFTYIAPGEGAGADGAGAGRLGGPNVKSVLADGAFAWVGLFKGGLDRVDLRTGRVEHFGERTAPGNGLSDINVYALHRRGSALWIGTFGGGLDILDLDSGRFTNYGSRSGGADVDVAPSETPAPAPAPISDLIRVIYEAPDGMVYLGTEHGLSRVRLDAEGRPRAFETVLTDGRVYALHAEPDGTLWVGTAGGGALRIGPDGARRRYRTPEGLAGNTVFGILPDGVGRLWMSTNEGLSQFDLASGEFTTYTQSGGLPTREFNPGAYRRLRDGDLVFGGIGGFTRFSPGAIVPDTTVPPVGITELTRRGKPLVADAEGPLAAGLDALDGLTFRYGEADFSIAFAALDYYSPESNRYRYKLEGVDREWTEGLGKGTATYTLQREGTYLLRVQGANADGRYNPAERQLRITVLPPWYRTPWAYLGYALAVLGAGFAAYRYVVLRQSLHREHLARERDEELHRGKLAFFTNITHEFRTPLTLIVGPLADLRKRLPHDPDLLERVDGIDRNARRLLDLVNRVLTFRKVASRHGGLHARQLDLVGFVRLATQAFRQAADHKGVEIAFASALPELSARADPEKIEIILANLLNNALKFTPPGGRVTVEVAAAHGDVQIRVRDTGCGIPGPLREQVFERFYGSEDTDAHVGTGIGLAFTRELVELHGGRITLAETPGGGATFTVRLPLEDAGAPLRPEPQVAEELLADPAAYEEEIVELASQAGLVAGGDPRQRLLIVEDNAEVSAYLASVFEDDYQLAFAKTGHEGIAAAHGPTPPHIIVSDVMMPEMDGLEMCEALKRDLATSHIPVLLLTARSGEAARLEGLRTGADDYLAKPFQPEEIRLRVRNVLRTRERAKALFTKVIKVEPSHISTTDPDEQFLIDALAAVERNLDDVNFGVVHLARELNVSRALLFTKMRALTNQTPASFIKHIRLKQATQLLLESHLNVSEVAYTVGFRDPKYFNKCFREEFGVPPSKYKESVVPSATES